MWHFITNASPQERIKWSAYVLFLVTPGSLLLLPVVWLIRRHLASQGQVNILSMPWPSLRYRG
jgi:hypothetical protein